MAHTRFLVRFLVKWGYLVLRDRGWPDDQRFLEIVYRLCLKREPDAEGAAFYRKALQRKSMTRWDVLRSVLRSNEFRQVHGLPVHPLNAVHQARMRVVQQFLPPAQVVLDLGGASEGHPEGALLVMGYPHHPQQILIVDLPPAGKSRRVEPTRELVTSDGILVVYHYGSMVDLSWLPPGRADLT